MSVFKRSATLRSLGLMVVLVAVMSLHASADDEMPCSVKALYSCLATAKGAYPPSPDVKCCTAVREADSGCLCREFDKTDKTKLSNNFVNNILALPKACGRTQLSGTHCGNYVFE